MSENQELNKPSKELISSDPNDWDLDEQDSLVGFFKILIDVDMRLNPDIYKLKDVNYEVPKNFSDQNNLNKTQ